MYGKIQMGPLGHRALIQYDNETPAGGGGGGTSNPPPPKTFTQDELNTLLADERRKTEGKYADYETLKADAAKLKKLEGENATEQERAVQKAKDEAASAKDQEWSAKLNDVLTVANTRLVEAAIKSKAVILGAADADLVWLVAQSYVHFSDKERPELALWVDDKGVVQGVEKVLEKVKKERAILFTTVPGGGGTPQLPRGNSTNDQQALNDQKRRQQGANEIVFGGGRSRRRAFVR